MKKITLTLFSILTGIASSSAIVVLTDSFSYPDGGIVTNSSGVWVQNTGTANSMLVSNQQLIVTTSRTEDIAAALSGEPYMTNGAVAALYASFTLRCTGLPTASGTYLAHFNGPNTFGPLSGHRARLWASITNFAQSRLAYSTNFLLSIVNTSGGNATNGQWITELTTNQTYTVVIKYQIATLTSTMWINPTSESDPSVIGNDFPVDLYDPAAGLVNVTHFSFRQATGEGTMWIDDLKVGTSFADVAGTNQPPSISGILNQSIAANSTTGPLPFTVSDAETPAGSLTVTASSSNPVLIPNSPANLTLGGSGTNRTITVTPAAGQEGSAVITLSVNDGALTNSTQFTVQVGFPSISSIPDQVIKTNETTGAIAFTVGDAETAAGSLVLTASSSNTNLVPQANIVFGGSGSNRTVTVTPVANTSGFANITVIVTDGAGNSAGTSFAVTVRRLIGLVFSENFSYADGPLYLQGPWLHHSPSGSNFDELIVTNGEAEVRFSLSEDLNAGLTNAPFAAADGWVLYYGFTVKCLTLPGSSGSYFIHFKDAGTINFKARVFANTANAASGKFRLGIANGAAGVNVQYPQDLDIGTTYAVVVRYNVATAKTALWVNPASESSSSVSATDATTATQVEAVALRQDSGIGVQRIDNLKVATSFSEVLNFAVVQPVITSIIIVGGNVQVDFSGGPGDSTNSFQLHKASVVSGGYANDGSATLSQLGPGSFRATTALSGSEQYYRILRP